MRALTLPLLTAGLLASASTLPAQDTKPTKTPSADRVVIESDKFGPDVQVFARGGAWSGAKSMIGVSTSSTGARDTLGLLVTGVTPNGPAEKAGIVEGNRIAAINGVNLRLAAADAGQDDMNGITARRLSRELGKLDPGTSVDLRIYADGQWKTLKVRTIAPDSLNPVRIRLKNSDDRAVLGFELNSTGSKRDTLGVLIASVHEDGPAEKAGLIEGDRVAAVNGTDLRVRHDDAGDDWVSGAMVTRFQRVMRSAKPGDKIELRVWSGGQSKTVNVTAAKASELYKDQMRRIRVGSGPMVWGMDGDQLFPSIAPRAMIAPVPAIPPMPPMPGFYAPRARVQSFDMDDEDEEDLVDVRTGADDEAGAALKAALEAARRAAVEASRSTPGARLKRSEETIRADRTRAAQRALMSSAARALGGTPTIATSWSSDGLLADAASTETGLKRVNIPGLSVASVTPELAEYLGKGSKDGYLVLESSGHWSALREGDVLLSVDGNCVNDGGITSSNEAHEVVVLRKGKRLTLRLAGG